MLGHVSLRLAQVTGTVLNCVYVLRREAQHRHNACVESPGAGALAAPGRDALHAEIVFFWRIFAGAFMASHWASFWRLECVRRDRLFRHQTAVLRPQTMCFPCATQSHGALVARVPNVQFCPGRVSSQVLV